ncbi:hypothetical protein EMIHUDRAFT_200551 [Emiliania huxleyi CCMP1516]|uniref:VTT domain-containing protein n=2 Tax=Emiliania huxleyi TaxID=2903 RepID=A0A0D3KQR6_EMIH1|nr:hypothetical protein EMIHUDRAFT_200551 [Emiliania huxleyi CCMP1516]EOD38101.1 hypothetical protein EMIHUDRAFT_200551 [Emiliania huxleyi CCMP1516]|eukprot:XP_005790530.1 hypothetical protein EMIHUDRAFT_200551 [Emiliania huxleyi CCMP1516]
MLCTSRAALDRAIAKEGALSIVVLLRLSPAMPLVLASALLAFTQVSLGPYTAGTVVGLLPFSAVYCYAGAAGAEVAADAASGAAGAHEEGPGCVHYDSDNRVGLSIGQEVIARRLPDFLAQFGADRDAVRRKIEQVRTDWSTYTGFE